MERRLNSIDKGIGFYSMLLRIIYQIMPYLAIFFLMILMTGCALPKQFYRNSMRWEPVMASRTIEASVLIEAECKFTDDLTKLGYDYLNPEINLSNFKQATCDAIMDDMVKSLIFRNVVLPTDKKYEFLIKIVSIQSKTDEKIKLSIIDPNNNNIIASYDGSAVLPTTSKSAEFNMAIRGILADLRNKMINDYQEVGGRKTFAAKDKPRIAAVTSADRQVFGTTIKMAEPPAEAVKQDEGTPTAAKVEEPAAKPPDTPDLIPTNIPPSGYTLECLPMVTSLRKGDAPLTLTHADALCKKAQTTDEVKQNKHLALLERGKVALMAGNYDQAIADLQEAEKRFLMIEGTISLTEGFGSLLSDDTTVEYEAEMHEKLMISPYLVLAYLGKGDFEGARVERNRTITKINQYIEEKPQERAYLENPFARYLTALMYEMEDKKDDARIEYRKLKWDQEIDRLDSKKVKTTDLVILVDTGLSPQKYQKKWGPQKIPTPQGLITLGFAYAGYAPMPSEIKSCIVYLNDKSVGDAKLLYDLEKTILTQYDRNKANLDAKLVARMTTKILTQVAAKMAAKEALKKIPFASMFADVAVDAAAETWLAAEQADLRGWLSLPKQIRYLRLDGVTPGEHTIKIDYGCGVETRKIKVEKDNINITYFANAR
jgi:hypothetical protein